VRRNPVGASLIATLCVGLVGALALLGMVDMEKNKTKAALRETEEAKGESDRAVRMTVALLNQQLEGLWLISELKVLKISSDQWHVLSALPTAEVSRAAKPDRFTFGLAANESPVSDARRYAPLLAHLEERLAARRGRPVQIGLNIYKFKEDRVEAIGNGEIDFARMGTIYYLQTKAQHPGIEALVEAAYPAKSAIFFTHTNRAIHTLAALKGQSVAFGDNLSGITFWGLVKLAEAGVTGKDLREYVFLDSRSEFIEEVHALGYQATTNRWGWLHSTADVIESVLKDSYVAGVTTERGFEKNRHRGLVRIPDSAFDRRPSPWVARENLSADLARDFIEIMTSLQEQEILSQLPDHPAGFRAITEMSHAPERAAMPRIEKLFPAPVAQGSNDLTKPAAPKK
jgi:ABC-type phosphate/phosphonate transport system substrate-binding protein